MPTFSVIIPTYNSEDFIEETIKSVIDQTFKDFELIIIDDGSEDRTRDIITKYKHSDPRLRIVTTPNSGGPATPTNIGIGLATGLYIAFVDHDDTWAKTKLETLAREYKNNPHVGFILSNVRTYSEHTHTSSLSKTKIRNRQAAEEDLLAGKYFNTFSMISIRQEVLNRVGSLDTNLLIFSDYDIITRMISFNIPHIFLAEPLVTYRIHTHNTSSLSSSAQKRAEDLQRIVTKYAKTFSKNKKSLSHVHHAIGSLYLYLGDVLQARKHYKIALKNNPLNIFMYLRLLFAQLGQNPYRFFISLKKKAFRNVS